MPRISVKFAGMQGQGVNSVGEIFAQSLKRKGYCIFGYREYMSLIKGGHSSYQLDIDTKQIRSSESQVDIMVCLNYYGLKNNLDDVKDGGILIHRTPEWKFTPEQERKLKRRKVKVIYINVEKILKEIGGVPILGNTIITAFVWILLGEEVGGLKKLIRKRFGHKKNLVEVNMKSIDAGVQQKKELAPDLHIELPKPKAKWQKQLLITGSECMGMGALHAGVRMYVGYPMTPASPLLTYMAATQNESGIVFKQAEDEITASQMCTGAMFAGCRAFTATAGGGIDLMSETLSLNGIIENPLVLVLAQRAGPGTGVPTWTGQGDLLMGVNAGHGEFPRCVLGAADAQSCFDLMPIAFNIAEKYQLPVILTTDKHAQEALYTTEMFDQKKTPVERHIVSKAGEVAALSKDDRYDPTVKNGISKRWLPGTEAPTYCANGDEHTPDGTVDETAQNTIDQMDKRMRKMAALKKELPEPVLYGNKNPKVVLVGWGSTKGVVLDALEDPSLKDVGYLHYEYLWPVKTGKLEKLAKTAKKIIAVEGNWQGQMAMVIQKGGGPKITDTILKYDGRPFFTDELISLVQKKL